MRKICSAITILPLIITPTHQKTFLIVFILNFYLLFPDTNEEKSLSARTITLRSSDERSPTKDNASAKSQDNSSRQQSGAAEKQSEKEEEQAATKIQAVFRGHKTRQSMKQPTAPPAKNEDTSGGNTTATNEPTREQLEEEFRLDDAGEYEIELLTLRL